MTRVLFSSLVERAIRVAARCHRDQNRKSSDLPYISHPASVALILLRAGFDDDCILAAALLHDVVEDTAYTQEQIAEEFPAKVSEIVADLTEHKTDANGKKIDWETRKTDHIAHITSMSVESRAVILADKLHNLASMLYDLENGDELWERFNASPQQLVWYHTSVIDAASTDDDPRLEQLATSCRELLAQLASFIDD